MHEFLRPTFCSSPYAPNYHLYALRYYGPSPAELPATVALQVGAAMIANMLEDEFAPLDHSSCRSADEADVSLNVGKLGQRVSDNSGLLTPVLFLCCWMRALLVC